MTIPSHEQTALWTDADYFAFPAMNATALKQLAKNPMQYQHHLAHPTKKTPAMTMGSAIHCLTFEPDEFFERYAVWEGPGNRRTKAYKEWAAANEGRDILTEDEHARALAVAEAATRHPLLQQLLGHPGTKVERAIVWQGLFGPCKAKLDLLHYSDEHGLIIVDLKTTSSELDEHSITHTIGRYRVHLQLYHYLQAAWAMYAPMGRNQVQLIALYARTAAPHDVVACELGPNTIMETAALYRDLADLYDGCTTMGHWPGYQKRRIIEVPDYYTHPKT